MSGGSRRSRKSGWSSNSGRGRGRHRPVDPRRHRRARPARQESDVDLAPRRPRRAPRRPEGAARREDMGGESEAAWRALLDDLVARGLKTPEFLIVDGAAGLEKALAALWPEVPTQRCTVGLLKKPG